MPAPRKKLTTVTAPQPGVATEDEGKKSGCRPDEMPADVLEFITAIDDYKRLHQRPFPTWSEVLEVVKKLGYARAG